MGALRLRRFTTVDQQRLGLLLARLKGGQTSGEEETELFDLLTKARRVSDGNARTLAEMRGQEGNGESKIRQKSR
jgi:hypothetical protein